MTPMDENLTALFLEFSRKQLLEQYWPRLEECVELLDEEQVWWRPNEASNSIGNLLLHLNGNVRQWLVVSFGRQVDQRNRPLEFSEHGPVPKSVLMEQLGATVRQACDVLARLTAADLLAAREIQGYKTRGLDVVFHVVEHFGQHFGQIAYITKIVTERGLGFYKELDKTGRIIRFREKDSAGGKGCISTGIYVIRREIFEGIKKDKVISLEKELLPALVSKRLFGYVTRGRFIDIGIPETYRVAKAYLRGFVA